MHDSTSAARLSPPRTLPIVGQTLLQGQTLLPEEASAEVFFVTSDTPEPPAEPVAAPTETPEIFKTIQEAWEKLEDKYAVTSLAVAGGVALWASAGVVSVSIDMPILY